MADNQLIIKDSGLVPLIEQNGLADIIKPLIREIHLFDSYIAGTSYLKDPSVLEKLNPGDRLSLQRESGIFDDNAIILLNGKGEKLGYVPEKDNVIFARLMDAGKLLTAAIKSIEKKGSFCRIGIEIFLVDI